VNNIEAYTSLARFDSFLYMLDKMEASWFADGREGRGRMLEIGSAAGYFLAASRARGWEATGIEPAAEISEWSRRYLHVPAETKFFEQVEAGDGSLDAVVATEVLEHVVDPLAMLRRVRRMLKPAGMVFLTTPNVECPTARPGGPTAGILAPLDHLNLFSARALEALLRKAGFAEVRVEADGPDGFQLQAYAFAETGGKAVAGRPTAADLGRELAGLREANRALRAELAEANRLLESLGTAAST
jgi:SAM-dependent methyltransferase